MTAPSLPEVREVKERPILFSAPMVRAILEGRKTQTRRGVNLDTLHVRLPYTVKSDLAELDPGTSIKAKPGTYRASINPQGAVSINVGGTMLGLRPGEFDFVCPYADGTTRLVDGRWHIETRGDRLWVRETHAIGEEDKSVLYAADDWGWLTENGKAPFRWRPSIHMPRWASRITLEVTGVRVERLQDISEADARAEGMGDGPGSEWALTEGADLPRLLQDRFEAIWRSINGAESWDANPFCWVIEFKREVPHV